MQARRMFSLPGLGDIHCKGQYQVLAASAGKKNTNSLIRPLQLKLVVGDRVGNLPFHLMAYDIV